MRDLDGSRGGDADDVILTSDQRGRAFEIVTAAAFDAEEVGSEDGFPKFGTFLKVRQQNGNGGWVELPADLERQLVEKGEEGADGGTLEGLVFRVANCRKDTEGSWRYKLEWFDSFSEASESL